MNEAAAVCEHDNGQMFPNLSGVCIKCGADLDKIYFQRRIEELEKRVSSLEDKVK